jgi:uncharacterized protein YybS (DUF2232 family)
MTRQRVSPLVEGAFLALIAAGLGALAIYFFPVKFLVDYIWGIPLIIIVKKYNLRTGLLTLATTFFITWLLTDPVMTLLLIVELAPLALAYALLFKHEIRPGVTLLSGVIVALVSDLVTVLGYLYLAKVHLLPTEEALKMQAQQFIGFYTNFGMSAVQAKQLVETAVKLTIMLIPSTLATVAIFRAFLTYIVATKILRKLNYRVEPLPPFSEWRLPWYSIWSLILGLSMSLAGDQYKIKMLSDIGKNLVFVVIPLFLVIGIAVFTHFFKTWRIPSWLKIMLVISAFINISASVVLFVLIGIFDPVVSFRKWNRPKE